MKKALLLFSFIGLFAAGTTAQITLDNPPSVVFGGYTYADMEAHFSVINVSSASLNVHVFRNEISVVPNTSNYFCFGVWCYPGFVDHSTNTTPIGSYATDTTFIAHYAPSGQAGISTIEYCFYDIADSVGSMTCTTIDWDATYAVGIGEIDAKNQLSEAYPSPASSLVNFKYSVGSRDAKIMLYNVLGAEVAEHTLPGLQGVVVVPVSELENGVYFYALVVDGKVETTRKLVVSH